MLHSVILVWFLIFIAESIHGIIQQLFIAPVAVDLKSRQIIDDEAG
jgi:hypothetical protein